MPAPAPSFPPAAPAPPSHFHEPLVSSASRGWRGIEVELHHFAGVDWLVPMARHIVAVHVAGTVDLLQSRGGRTVVKHVRPGDVTVSPRGEPKRFQHGGDNVVILLKLDPAYLDAVAAKESGAEPGRFEMQEVPGRPDPQIARIGERMVASLGEAADGGRLRAESLATELALHLLAQYGATRAPAAKPASQLSPRNLQRAKEYIDANLREDMSLETLAGVVAMSPGHFAHAFKASTGLPPHRYVVARRMDLAKMLLRESRLSITEIAHYVGCATHSHFSVAFLRMTGHTPSDFRALL